MDSDNGVVIIIVTSLPTRPNSLIQEIVAKAEGLLMENPPVRLEVILNFMKSVRAPPTAAQTWGFHYQPIKSHKGAAWGTTHPSKTRSRNLRILNSAY